MQIPGFPVYKGELEDSIPELGLHMDDVHAAGNSELVLIHDIPFFEGGSIVMPDGFNKNA